MDRREYQRITVEAAGTFYIRNENEYIGDFSGVISDVSENGICVETDIKTHENTLDKIAIGSIISFDAIEEYEFYDDLRRDVFAGKIEIVRKETRGDSIVLGCKITPPNACYDQYVKDRKTSIFISQLRKH